MNEPKHTDFVLIRLSTSGKDTWIVKKENLKSSLDQLGNDYVFFGTYQGYDQYCREDDVDTLQSIFQK